MHTSAKGDLSGQLLEPHVSSTQGGSSVISPSKAKGSNEALVPEIGIALRQITGHGMLLVAYKVSSGGYSVYT